MFEKERIVGKESDVKVAVIQSALRLGDVDYNIEKGVKGITEAADAGAKLVVLTELSNSGYTFNNREEAFTVAEDVPGGNTISQWEKLAKEKKLFIVGGICECEGALLYNTAALVGPDGFIGKYRKMHLWDCEKLWFAPGNLGMPVFETEIGRISMLICYDIWFQEMWRICGAKGADIVCCPVNWVRIPVLGDFETFGPHNAMVGVYDNGLCAAISDRIGEERGLVFPGRSMILGPLGLPISGEASGTEEEIKYADLNLMDARRLHWAEFAGARLDRRTDYYDVLCGADDGEPTPF